MTIKRFITKGKGPGRKVIPMSGTKATRARPAVQKCDRNIDRHIKAYELGNLSISKGGNFLDFLERLMTYYKDNKGRSEYLKTDYGTASAEYMDMNIKAYDLGNLDISPGGNFENWLGNLIQFYRRDTGQDKEYLRKVKEMKARKKVFDRVKKDISPIIKRYGTMTEDAPDPEHVSGGGIDIFKDDILIGSLYYKGTPLERKALVSLKAGLEKKGLTVKTGDLWYPH